MNSNLIPIFFRALEDDREAAPVLHEIFPTRASRMNSIPTPIFCATGIRGNQIDQTNVFEAMVSSMNSKLIPIFFRELEDVRESAPGLPENSPIRALLWQPPMPGTPSPFGNSGVTDSRPAISDRAENRGRIRIHAEGAAPAAASNAGFGATTKFDSDPDFLRAWRERFS